METFSYSIAQPRPHFPVPPSPWKNLGFATLLSGFCIPFCYADSIAGMYLFLHTLPPTHTNMESHRAPEDFCLPLLSKQHAHVWIQALSLPFRQESRTCLASSSPLPPPSLGQAQFVPSGAEVRDGDYVEVQDTYIFIGWVIYRLQ